LIVRELLEIAKFILGFLPWILFLLLPTDGWEPLRRAVVICLAVSIIFTWKGLRKGFILQWGTLLFFLFCTISLYGFSWIWLAGHMGIIANSVLTGIIWITVIIGKPFTLQYARADLPREQWNDKQLVRGCRFIAVCWGILLLIPTVLSFFRFFFPIALSDAFYFYISLFCIIIGISYTTYYKSRKRKQRENHG
jgi:hypothetical protein